MKLTRKTQFIVALLLPLIILCALTYKPLLAYWTGESITVKTVPIDPRDLLYGDYVYLELDINFVRQNTISSDVIEQIQQINDKNSDNLFFRPERITVYSVLKEEESVYSVEKVVLDKPDSGIYLKGEMNLWARTAMINSSSEYYIDYGLNRFYMEENTGKELEGKATRGELELKLKVSNGYALIEDIIIPYER